MYHCTSCSRDIELPDYSEFPNDDDEYERICPENDCGKRTVEVRK